MTESWRDILFAERWYSPTDDGDHMQDEEPWAHASATQLMALCKLLGVEQNSIAAFLGVHKSMISLWINKRRPTPAKYRPALGVYVKATLQKALSLKAKEVLALPPVLQDQTAAEFAGLLGGWRIETVHGRQILTWFIKEQGKELTTLLAQERWTAAERQTLRTLCQTMQAQLKTLDELEAEQAGEQT